MKFVINNRQWEIKEVSKEWLLEEYKKEYADAVYCFGLTRYSKQIIYLNEEMCPDVKRQTLLHELMHCYLWSYIHVFSEMSEEAVCDISANSHDIIHEIVDNYFNRVTLGISVKPDIDGVNIVEYLKEAHHLDKRDV